MIVIAVTGGVACGKSSVTARLSELLKAPVFNCDESVAELLEEEEVQSAVLEKMAETGAPDAASFDKVNVRKHAFENSNFREKLEHLIHPMVYQEAVGFLDRERAQAAYSFVEVPLLYEVEFPLDRDLDLVVAASPTTQLLRLTEERDLDPEVAKQILAAQLPIEEKIRKADIVVWNDGSMEALNTQVEHLAKRCLPKNS
ncbi:MAG: dephospho-CoA kinase [Verrucomicrobiota bacterium]